MSNTAYNAWINLFDDDISNTWSQEQKEMQKTAMLVRALQKELKKVYSNLELEILDLRNKLDLRNQLKNNYSSKTVSKHENKENEPTLKLEPFSQTQNDYTFLESPDLFNNIANANLSILQNSPTEVNQDNDSTRLDDSPTISKSRKHFKRKKSNKLKDVPLNNKCDVARRNIFKAPKSDSDDTVIDCTPEATNRMTSKKSSYLSRKKNRKKTRDTSLTQIFVKTNIVEKEESKDAEALKEMGISDLLDYINGDNTELNETCNDSTDVAYVLSKGGFLDDSDIISPKKPKITSLPEPIVRGNARKELKGFSCQQCRDFYSNMKLSPEELQKKMDDCSKHRYKYNPPEETAPGFWDLTFSSQVKEVRK